MCRIWPATPLSTISFNRRNTGLQRMLKPRVAITFDLRWARMMSRQSSLFAAMAFSR